MFVIDFEQFCVVNLDICVECFVDGKVWIMVLVNLELGYYEGEVFGELCNYCFCICNGKVFSFLIGFQLFDGFIWVVDVLWVLNEWFSQLIQV